MSALKYNSKNLGAFLVGELFATVKEVDPFLKKCKSPEAITKSKHKWSKEDELKVVRFCTLSLELYNCAERFFNTFPSKREAPRLKPYTELFLSGDFSKKQFDEFMSKFKLEVVFTAHPTEVFPLSVQKNLNRIEMLVEKFVSAKSADRQYRYIQALKASFTTLWLTDEIYRSKPTPEDEADRLFYTFEASLWKASPYFYRRYYIEYKKKYGEAPKDYPNLKFSSWIGGDRDGNPFVTCESTYNIITKSRRKILRLILLELYPLRDETLIKSSQKKLKSQYKDETFPYRALFEEIVFKVKDTLREKKTDDVAELQTYILERLRFAFEMLCKDGAKRVADRRLRSLIDRVKAFSLSPLKLDLRQDSEIHTAIIDELKKLTDCKDELCLKKVKKLPFDKLSPLGKDFFQTMALAKSFNPNPFNCYIISMTRSVQDLKNLETLFKISGVENIPTVPLFETPDDIRNASNIITSAKKEGVKLTQVMWGYSDSTKKGGRLASAWNVFKAQKEARKLDPSLIHFHGRGGSIARGGGEIGNVFGVMPSGLVGHHFRQTFQGEVIQDEFGLSLRAVNTLEGILKESVANHFKKDDSPSSEVSKQLDELSDKSEKAFYKKFYEEETFSKAFAESSPIDIINKLNLGSRPAKRASKKTGVSYRAIPWVFSWAQTRGALPVWYGLQGLEKQLLSLKTKTPFTRSFVSSVKQGLYLTDVKIFKDYFGKSLEQEAKELETMKSNFQVREIDLGLRTSYANYLHKTQNELMKKTSLTALEDDIEKITAQGIASFLGRSG
jgi:phosphoenolpyruvate carboxylase